jgi:hypothetical protein
MGSFWSCQISEKTSKLQTYDPFVNINEQWIYEKQEMSHQILDLKTKSQQIHEQLGLTILSNSKIQGKLFALKNTNTVLQNENHRLINQINLLRNDAKVVSREKTTPLTTYTALQYSALFISPNHDEH